MLFLFAHPLLHPYTDRLKAPAAGAGHAGIPASGSSKMSTPSSDLLKEGHNAYVLVKVHDGTTYRGYLHVPGMDRIQDLLNDGRQFIPLRLSRDTGEIVILSKQFIVSIEEVGDHEVKPFHFG